MYFTYKYTKIYYEKHGNNKKVILIFPGWGDNRKTFYKMIDDLKDDFTIYIFDYPGFGNSPIPHKDLTIYDYFQRKKDGEKYEYFKYVRSFAHKDKEKYKELLAGEREEFKKRYLL